MALRKCIDRRLLVLFSSAALLALLLLSLLSPIEITTSQQESRKDEYAPASKILVDLPPTVGGPISLTSPETATTTTIQDVSSEIVTKPSHATYQNTSSNGVSHSVPITQGSALYKHQLHVVISHYAEEPYYIRAWIDNLRSIPYVQELGVKIFIYTKGPDTDLTALKDVSGADEVVRLPNVGREGGTYLHHLLSVYDDPPQYLMFTQSYIKKGQQEKGEHTGALKQWLFDRLNSKFGNDTGFMSLDRKHDICYCGHCTDMGRDDFYPLWPQIYTLLQGTLCQELEGHVLSFNGHFIVSKTRVVARPKSIYKYLQELVDAPESHWIHAEPEPKWFDTEKGKSVPSNPKFGHTLERLWHVLFNCSDPADMTDCDLKGMRAEGPGGCTCKDLSLSNVQ